MRRATIIAFGLATLCGVYLTIVAGWPIVVIGIASIIAGYAYTAGPMPLAYSGLAEPFVLIFFGPVAVGGTYFVQAGGLTDSVLLASLSPGLFAVSLLIINNLRDVSTDRSVGKRTLAVRFGPAFARLQYVLTLALAFLVPVVLVIAEPLRIWSLQSLLVILPTIFAIRVVFTYRDPRQLNSVLGLTGVMLFLHALLFGMGWLQQ